MFFSRFVRPLFRKVALQETEVQGKNSFAYSIKWMKQQKKNRTSIWRATKKMYLAIEGQRYETNSRNVSCTSLINIHFDGEYFYMSFDSAIVFAFDSGATNKASYLYMWSLVDESNDSSHFPCRLIIVWVVFFPLSFSFSNINSIVVYA